MLCSNRLHWKVRRLDSIPDDPCRFCCVPRRKGVPLLPPVHLVVVLESASRPQCSMSRCLSGGPQPVPNVSFCLTRYLLKDSTTHGRHDTASHPAARCLHQFLASQMYNSPSFTINEAIDFLLCQSSINAPVTFALCMPV
jgi:hypothetical protein